MDFDARVRRLRAALAAVLVRDRARELDLVHQWLDTWAGLGLVVAGTTHQGGEGRALSHLALHADRAAMQLHELSREASASLSSRRMS